MSWYQHGTSRTFRHGPDVTITREHIDEAQAARLLNGQPPLSPDELVRDLVHFPKRRHLARAERLMVPKEKESA